MKLIGSTMALQGAQHSKHMNDIDTNIGAGAGLV